MTAKRADLWLIIYETEYLTTCHKNFGSNIRIEIISQKKYDVQTLTLGPNTVFGKDKQSKVSGTKLFK